MRKTGAYTLKTNTSAITSANTSNPLDLNATAGSGVLNSSGSVRGRGLRGTCGDREEVRDCDGFPRGGSLAVDR